MSPAVWITRPGDGGERTLRAVAGAGFDAFHLPLLEVTLSDPDAPLGPPWPDWLILVSVNAVDGFLGALARRGLELPGRGTRVAATGARTARRLAERGIAVEFVPGKQRAEGLLEVFGDIDLVGRRIWIPCGTQEGPAVTLLPEELEARGADVRNIPVYATGERRPTGPELQRLGAREPGAAVLHSPSAARALECLIVERREAAPWREAWMVAIGPTTEREASRCGFLRTRTCAEPSDGAVVAALMDIGHLTTRSS